MDTTSPAEPRAQLTNARDALLRPDVLESLGPSDRLAGHVRAASQRRTFVRSATCAGRFDCSQILERIL
jgi:hypothetical protein